MQLIKNCFRIIRDYWHTPKGRHDIIDYAKGLALFLAAGTLLTALVAYFSA